MSDIESKVEEIDRLQQLVSNFRKESEIIDRIQEKAKENVVKTKAIVSELQSEKRARKMENAKSKGLREKDLARISELNQEIRRLNTKIRELEQQMEQQQDANQQIGQLEKALEECLKRKDELERRIASLEITQRQHIDQMQNANKERDEAIAKAESMLATFEKLEIQSGESEKWRKIAIDQRELCEERLKEAESKYSDTWDAWVRNKLSGEDQYSSGEDDSPV